MFACSLKTSLVKRYMVYPFCMPKIKICVNTMVYRRKEHLRTSLKVYELETLACGSTVNVMFCRIWGALQN